MTQASGPVVLVHGLIGTLRVPQVSHLRQVLERSCGPDAVDLVGHSIGGVVAMLYACAYPSTSGAS